MKILEENKPCSSWSLEVICTGGSWNQDSKVPCNSKLEIDANDLVKRKWFKYPDYDGIDYGFICPVCKCFTEIQETKLNGHLKNMAIDYDNIS